MLALCVKMGYASFIIVIYHHCITNNLYRFCTTPARRIQVIDFTGVKKDTDKNRIITNP